MNTIDLIINIFNNIQSGNLSSVDEMLSEDFTSDVFHMPVDQQALLTAYRSLLIAVPDLRIILLSASAIENIAYVKIAVSGTHAYPFPAFLKGWQKVPATHKRFGGLVVRLTIIFKNEKISEIKNTDGEKGLFISLMESLGINYQELQNI